MTVQGVISIDAAVAFASWGAGAEVATRSRFLSARPAQAQGDLSAEARLSAERQLEDAVRRGDPDALDRLVTRELPRVERLLLRVLGPRADLEDWVQNVFLEACRALPSFRGDSTLSTFIGGITIRVARRAMRPTAWWRRSTPMLDEPADHAPSPEAQVIEAEQLKRARKALDRIAPKKRIAFLLWAVEGMSVEEIASTTGASVSATRSQIFYAQKELKKRAMHDPYLKGLVGEDAE